MVPIPKIIGAISCSVVLGLSVSSVAQARMSPGPCADMNRGEPTLLRCDDETMRGINTIKGEVLRVEGSNYYIGRFDGKRMWLHVDQTTKMIGHIGRGDRIEAKVGEVDYQTHVLSLRQIP